MIVRVMVIALAVALMAAACNGDDGDAGVTPTTDSTSTVTATPPAPTAEDPVLPANARELAVGSLELNVPPGEPSLVDPLALAEQQDVEPPACAGFVFAFTWQVTSPVSADAPLTVEAERQGTATELGSGGSGAATTGCEVLRFSNDGADPLHVEVRYRLGSLE